MRVIAGEAKGRELIAPKGLKTRPTLAKVKEAMFGMIQFDVEGADVLDLFSGSGGLGIEAISRGARRAVFCDADRLACSAVRANIERLGFEDRAEVHFGDAIALLNTLSSEGVSFDIVLLDPPYESDLETRAVSALEAGGLLKPGSILVCEHSLKNPPVFSSSFTVRKARKYGDCYLTYAVFEGEEDQ